MLPPVATYCLQLYKEFNIQSAEKVLEYFPGAMAADVSSFRSLFTDERTLLM